MILRIKQKSNSCHTCRSNWLEEQVENRYVARFNIMRGAFWWLEMNQVGDHRGAKLYSTLVKSLDQFLCDNKRKSCLKS